MRLCKRFRKRCSGYCLTKIVDNANMVKYFESERKMLMSFSSGIY